jgi:hypothetical protein
MERIRAEDLKFEIFNSLNSTDDFDITCEWRAPIGSNIPRRFCDVGYMKNARTEDATYIMDTYLINSGTDGYHIQILQSSDHELVEEFSHETEALNKEMVDLSKKHPSLTKARIKEYELKQRYIVEQRKKFKDSILIGHTALEKYFGDELKFLNVAYLAYNDGIMKKQEWQYWDKRLRSIIHQEPYRSIWLSTNTDTFVDAFVAYVNKIVSAS